MTAVPLKQRILVISAQGLARFVPALGAMGAIRAHHSDTEIILLTARECSAFAATSPYFDQVWSDESEGSASFRRVWPMRAKLRIPPFDRVYDLDATAHSKRLFQVMYGWQSFKPTGLPWSGEIPGTALAHTDPRRRAMHLADRWAAQVKVAGIGAILRPDLSWVARQVTSFAVPFRMTEPFVMIAASPGPGAAWSAETTGELASELMDAGQTPVLVGLDVPAELCAAVQEICPATVDLTGKATVNELVFLAWAATAVVGPDNGVMQLAAAAGCRTVVLFNSASDPALVGPRGARVTILRRPSLAEISVGEVIASLFKK